MFCWNVPSQHACCHPLKCFCVCASHALLQPRPCQPSLKTCALRKKLTSFFCFGSLVKSVLIWRPNCSSQISVRKSGRLHRLTPFELAYDIMLVFAGQVRHLQHRMWGMFHDRDQALSALALLQCLMSALNSSIRFCADARLLKHSSA